MNPRRVYTPLGIIACPLEKCTTHVILGGSTLL